MFKKRMLVPILVLGLAGSLLSPVAASATSDAVVPINWSSFTAGLPSDTNSVRLQGILTNANKYALTTWYNTAKNYAGQGGTYLTFGGTAEANIRPAASEALALAIAIKTGAYDPVATGVTLTAAKAITIRLLTSVAYNHLVNTSGGWGNDWQTAGWATYAGSAGWLMWSDLTSTDREYVRKMVEYETNRFNSTPAPYWNTATGDTKADENGWNAQLLQLATAMMPDHPNYATWSARSLEYMISISARPGDSSSSTVVNGKALSSWIPSGKYNINADGTLINHDIVHPDYMVSFTNGAYAALLYSLAGRATPAAAMFNADYNYDALVDLNFVAGTKPYSQAPTLLSPGGTIYVSGTNSIYYPNGNDWGTSRRIHFALADAQATAFGLDDLASKKGSYWEPYHAQAVTDMQARSVDGRTYVAAGEDTYSGREEWVALLAAQAYLTKWVVFQGAYSLENVSAPGERIIRETDAAMSYGGTWTTSTSYAGAMNRDERWTAVTSNYAQLTFTGTTVKWIGLKSSNQGNADVYVDGVLQTTVDLYAASDQLQQVLYSKTGLSAGSHTIKVVVKGTKNASSSGYYVNLDSFIITPWSLPPFYNDSDPLVTYGGSWTSGAVVGADGGDLHWTAVTSNYAQLTFTGTAVSWYGMKAPNRGYAAVYIDGALVATVDEYAASNTIQSVLYSKTGLSAGSHTIKIVNTGTKSAPSSGYYIDLDSFHVS